jgi:hypothetical protein
MTANSVHARLQAVGKRKSNDTPRRVYVFLRRALSRLRPEFYAVCAVENIEGVVPPGAGEAIFVPSCVILAVQVRKSAAMRRYV